MRILKELNISNFNTSNVTDMSYMFQGCESLEELDLSHFNMNQINNIYAMFCKCKLLKVL